MKRELAQRMFRFFVGKKSRIIQVHGMRRSGNHACIDWIANALLKSHVAWTPSSHRWISFSESGEIAHLNNVGAIPIFDFVQGIWAEKRGVRAARHLIVSFEDCRPGVSFKEIAKTKIQIERPVADILASRYHNINKRAKLGQGWSSQSIRENFFSTLSELNDYRYSNAHEKITIWNFDQWKTSSIYRKEFLKSIRLECDVMPRMSKVGGGSSFNLSAQDNSDRIAQVSPKKEWIEYLKWVESNHLEAIDPSSRSRIQAFLRKQETLTN